VSNNDVSKTLSQTEIKRQEVGERMGAKLFSLVSRADWLCKVNIVSFYCQEFVICSKGTLNL